MADPHLANLRDFNQTFGRIGTTSIDFGAFPGTTDASVDVRSQAGINANAVLEAWIVATATADHSVDEHRLDAPILTAGNIIPGQGFTIYGVNQTRPGSKNLRTYGKWSVAWRWTN